MAEKVEVGQLRQMYDDMRVAQNIRGSRLLVLRIDPDFIDPDFNEPPYFWICLMDSSNERVFSDTALRMYSEVIG